MQHQIGFCPVGTPCPVRLGLAGKRPASSQNWSRSFISGFESGPLSKLNTCGFNFPLFLALFSPPPHPSLRGNKKNSLPCRQRDTVPFAKENLSSQSPGEQRAPKFPLHPPVEGGGLQTGPPPSLPPRPGGISRSLYLPGSRPWNSAELPPHLLRRWDMLTQQAW